MDISNIVANLFLPSNLISDKRVWGLSPDGNYSVKSGLEIIQGFSLQPKEPSVFFLFGN